MDDKLYWRIKYKIELLTDAHIGDGTMELGGNLHALCTDEDGFPFLPDTQVRGLLRLAGQRMGKDTCLPGGDELLKLNFGARGKRNGGNLERTSPGLWSFTRAEPSSEIREHFKYKKIDLFAQQAHIKVRLDENEPPRPFAFQKTGGAEDKHRFLEGTIYSHSSATDQDVAFMIACMKFDDRIGARRSRGYGKVRWHIDAIHQYEAGGKLLVNKSPLEWWIKQLLKGVQA